MYFRLLGVKSFLLTLEQPIALLLEFNQSWLKKPANKRGVQGEFERIAIKRTSELILGGKRDRSMNVCDTSF